MSRLSEAGRWSGIAVGLVCLVLLGSFGCDPVMLTSDEATTWGADDIRATDDVTTVDDTDIGSPDVTTAEDTEEISREFGQTVGTGSCDNKCAGKSTDCWCDMNCRLYGDCCDDICDFCHFDEVCSPDHPDYETDSDIRDDVPVAVPFSASGEVAYQEMITYGPFEVRQGETLRYHLVSGSVEFLDGRWVSDHAGLYITAGATPTPDRYTAGPLQKHFDDGYATRWLSNYYEDADMVLYWVGVYGMHAGDPAPFNPYTLEVCRDDNKDDICDAPPTIVEDFETGSWPWAPWVETGTTYAVRTAPEGAHDGNMGLELAEIPTYRTDVSFGLVEDEVLAAWVQPGTTSAGRIELGFDADAAGGYMLRLDSYTDTLSFRSNDFNGSEVELELTSADVEPGFWYLLEIQVGANGLFEGRVFESNGTTLVANLFHTFNGLTGMGIALSGNMNNRMDTIHTYMSLGSCSDSDGDGVCDTEDICSGDDAFGDSDADGVCEDLDICIGFDWLGDADTDGYCDHHVCAGDVPPFYDQAVSQASWTAGGACTEFEGIAGPTVCSEAEHQQHLTDMNWIMANYPWTNAVFDAPSGNMQSWSYSPYSLLCSGFPSMREQQNVFDDLNACYFGHSHWNFAFDSADIDFDWGVNVWKLVADYSARAATFGGDCSLSGLGGVGTGFHVSDQGDGSRLWRVHATDNCDIYGCRCDATVEVQTNPSTQPGAYTEVSLTNQSTFTLYEGMLCEDERFDF